MTVIVSQHLKPLYELYSYVLMAAAVFLYFTIAMATLVSAAWVEVGETPIFNNILLLYGAPVVMGMIFNRYHQKTLQPAAIIFSGIAAFIFISLEIRHLWQGSVALNQPTLSGELYTYSAVWLAMAIGAIFLGTMKFGNDCYRSGMALLALVIAKIFLIDMSDLEGLLRVASIMGLGLALLAISYLHQRIQRKNESAS